MMTHDFKAAFKEMGYAEYDRGDHSVGLPESYDLALSPQGYETVLLALNLADAVTGELSEGVCIQGDEITAHDFAKGNETCAEFLFKAMSATLIKEIEQEW